MRLQVAPESRYGWQVPPQAPPGRAQRWLVQSMREKHFPPDGEPAEKSAEVVHSWAMKPNPFSELKNFTVPEIAMMFSLSVSIAWR